MPSDSTPLAGEGVKLQISIASTFTDIANIVEIDGPELTVNAVKRTSMTDAYHKTRPSTKPELGKVTLKIQLTPNDTTTHSLLLGRAATPGTVDDWKIVFPDGQVVPAHVTFSGFVSKVKSTGMKAESEEQVTGEFEIQLTSVPVYTAGAAT